MQAQSLPLWAQLLGLLYIGTGVFRLVCHFPQAKTCLAAPHLAAGVSLRTWCGLLFCASVAFAYAVLVVGDLPLLVSTGCNVAGPVWVILSVLRARRMNRPSR